MVQTCVDVALVLSCACGGGSVRLTCHCRCCACSLLLPSSSPSLLPSFPLLCVAVSVVSHPPPHASHQRLASAPASSHHTALSIIRYAAAHNTETAHATPRHVAHQATTQGVCRGRGRGMDPAHMSDHVMACHVTSARDGMGCDVMRCDAMGWDV